MPKAMKKMLALTTHGKTQKDLTNLPRMPWLVSREISFAQWGKLRFETTIIRPIACPCCGFSMQPPGGCNPGYGTLWTSSPISSMPLTYAPRSAPKTRPW